MARNDITFAPSYAEIRQLLQDSGAGHTNRHSEEILSAMWPGFRAPCTLSVQLSDCTVWRHTWQKNWVNCAVLTGNSVGLRPVLSSRLSCTELRSSLREPHSFLSLPADTTMLSSQGTQQNWQETGKPDGKPVMCKRTFISVSRAGFLNSYTAQFNLECMGPLTPSTGDSGRKSAVLNKCQNPKIHRNREPFNACYAVYIACFLQPPPLHPVKRNLQLN
jgi:hypothetical protein